MPVKSYGEARALASLTKGPARFTASMPRAMHMCGSILVRTSQQGIALGTKTGIHHSGLPRRSSYFEGEYSAFQSGDHFNSIDYNVQGTRQFEFGAGEEHSVYLELGTGGMKPRKDLGRSVESEQSAVTRILGQIPFKALSR